MNVLVIAQYFPPDIRGSATRTSDMAKSLMHADCYIVTAQLFHTIWE